MPIFVLALVMMAVMIVATAKAIGEEARRGR